MSDEQRIEETEVEGHIKKAGQNDEPREDAELDDEVEGHVHKVQ